MNNNISQYENIHKKQKDYGASGVGYFDEVSIVIDYLKPKTVLDYGCGKGTLIKALQNRYPNIKFYGYDPAIPEKSLLPIKNADLVINTDVLEHIPEHEIDAVLAEISEISNNVFFALDHALAYVTLPNGDNAHCLIKPKEWYINKLSSHFKSLTSLDSQFQYKSFVLTFGVKRSFFEKFYYLIEQKKPKTNHSILYTFKCKLLSRIGTKKMRQHYRKRLNTRI